MVTAVLAGVFLLVALATALALAGRWQPEGLPESEPGEPAPAPAGGFEGVLRGYRMDQVDAEIDRLKAMLARTESQEVPRQPDDPRIEM
jgi:hypothetical protein